MKLPKTSIQERKSTKNDFGKEETMFKAITVGVFCGSMLGILSAFTLLVLLPVYILGQFAILVITCLVIGVGSCVCFAKTKQAHQVKKLF